MSRSVRGLKSGWRQLLVAGALTGAFGTRPATAADFLAVPNRDALARAGAEVAWRVLLPLRSVDSITSYDLADEYLFAMGSDGQARAIRADTGFYAWTRRLAGEFDKVWPPASYHAANGQAMVFTRRDDAAFLEPALGREVRTLRLEHPPTAAAVLSNDLLYTVGADCSLRTYRIEQDIPAWQFRSRHPVFLSPLRRGDLVVVADIGGDVAAVIDATGEQQSVRELGAEPRGWLAADDQSVFVATRDKLLHTLDPQTGRDRLPPRVLADRPSDGPIVSRTAVYQATLEGGLHRFARKPDSRDWLYPPGKRFLAEWPKRVAVLRRDGRVALLRPETGAEAAVLDVGEMTLGPVNTWNDAVIVGSPRGEVYCIRPIASKPLAPADFRPPPPTPQSKPAQTQPADEQEQPPPAEETDQAKQAEPEEQEDEAASP